MEVCNFYCLFSLKILLVHLFKQYMKKFLISLILSLAALQSFAQGQRMIVYGAAPWFAFDPLSNSYQKGSLAQIWGYSEAWREELGEENFFIMPHPDFYRNMPLGYKAYMASSGDSTLLHKIETYMGVNPAAAESFQLETHLPDSLKRGEILVIDKTEFFGDVSFETKVVDISEFPLSRDFMDSFDQDIQKLRLRFASPITQLDTSFTTRDCYFGPSLLAGLFHRYQLERTGADYSLFAPPRFDATWGAGDLYIKDVYRMLGYDNELVVVECSGALLLEFLEEVYFSRYYNIKRSSDDLVRTKTPYFFHESLAGSPYMVNLTKGEGQRIENHNIQASEKYKVAINSFRAKWFISKGCSSESFGDYRLEFLGWLSGLENFEALESVEQWRTLPEALSSEIAQRERKTIFE